MIFLQHRAVPRQSCRAAASNTTEAQYLSFSRGNESRPFHRTLTNPARAILTPRVHRWRGNPKRQRDRPWSPHMRQPPLSRTLRAPPGAGTSRRTRAVAGRADDLVIGRLDGQESWQRGLTRRVRVIRLGELPVGALDVGQGCASRQAERAIGVGIRGHRTDGRSSGSPGARPGRDQPISSPTGASSNSAIASAPSRPCGSRIAGR